VSKLSSNHRLSSLAHGLQVFERGWLSANNILLMDEESAVLIDSGYVTHAPQTLALVQSALNGRRLDYLFNTHLHSDHCGGNHALQNLYADLQTWIPPGHASKVSVWDDAALSYAPTGQECPRFHFQGLLQPGSEFKMAGLVWEIHAAPGHDPHSVILFERTQRTLISADALWEHGFGVVFPELEGVAAFHEVAQTLDLIESLNPTLVIPGHGAPFRDCAKALEFARQKLTAFTQQPEKHARYGAKVLIKFKLLEWHQIDKPTFVTWAEKNQYLRLLQETHAFGQPYAQWLDMILAELIKSNALEIDGSLLRNI
jgi:glyoxylase-like metal-dependent hydrolase (beta-lactamase superfamily II)